MIRLAALESTVMVNEQFLLSGARSLDPTVLAEIHDTYFPAIFRYIAYKVGDRQTAEDLTSEVFVRFLHAVRERHTPQNTIRGWLYKVAANLVNDHYRQKQRRIQEVALPDALPGLGPKPAEQIINKQTLENLRLALDQLTEEQRQVIELRYGWEMSIRDVAETIGKSQGAVKQLQARALASLARLMAP